MAAPSSSPDHRPGPDMAWIDGGTFLMGSDDHYPEEAPAHQVTVDGFWIDRHAVTNAEYARFVRNTGHLTVAERPADAGDYPGARPELLVPASTVFRNPGHRVDLSNPYQWWTYVPGADWRHPQGPASSMRKVWGCASAATAASPSPTTTRVLCPGGSPAAPSSGWPSTSAASRRSTWNARPRR
jgi:formylglycine-generating enzyme required for sulfatase activity